MATNYGLTPSGFVIRGYDNIRKENIEALRKIFPTVRDDISNPIIAWIDYFTRKIYEEELKRLEAYNNLYIKTATGQWLNQLVADRGIFRIPAQNASGMISITANKNTNFTTGVIVMTANGEQYISRNQKSIVWTKDETKDIEFIAVNGVTDGYNGNVGAHEIIIQNTHIYGVTKVDNKLPFTNGIDSETDTHLRGRYISATKKSASLAPTSLEAYIALNTKTKSVKVIENTSNVTKDGIPPHSYMVVTYGGTQDKILDAIFDKAIAGITSVGSISRTVNGVTRAYNEASLKKVYVHITVTSNGWDSVTTAQYKKQMQAKILDYFRSLEIGENVEKWRIDEVVREGVSGIKATDIKLGLTSKPTTSTPISISNKQIATFNGADLTLDVI